MEILNKMMMILTNQIVEKWKFSVINIGLSAFIASSELAKAIV